MVGARDWICLLGYEPDLCVKKLEKDDDYYEDNSDDEDDASYFVIAP